MKKVLAIGGRPGTGKSTLMKEFMTQFTDWERQKPVPLVDIEYSEAGDIAVIGKYDEGETFSGTDRLSMAVQPNALEFVRDWRAPSKIIFEGDRLFNGSFLRDLMDLKDVDLHVILLNAPQDILTARYIERGTDQTEKFLQSRATKYSNLLMSFDLMDVIHERRNMNLDDQKKIIAEIKDFLEI